MSIASAPGIRLSAALALSLVGIACSEPLPQIAQMVPGAADGGSETDDGGAVLMPIDAGDNGAPSSVYPAPFPDPPQVQRINGPVLDQPRFVPVFFSNDDMAFAAKLIDFDNKVGASDYWKVTTVEYGVGAAISTAPVILAETASGTLPDATIQTWLAAKLNAADPAFPTLGTDDIYILHYPTGVTITLNDGGAVSRSCREFGAYHGNIQLDNAHKRQRVAYAVMPRCKGFGGSSTIDIATVSESHELTEAATDPYPRTSPAYAQLDGEHQNWAALLGGGEVSDMCQQLPDTNVRPAELGYTVQRGWSNVAAKAGHDPCVPATGTYFAAAPELMDYVDYTFGSSIAPVIGVAIPVGEKRTITLDLFSDGPTTPFTVNARNTSRGNYLSFSLDRNRGVNGEKLHLTITSAFAEPNLAANFVVTATLNNVVHSWYGVVGQAP